MKSGDVRRIERLEGRRRATALVHHITDEEFDQWERAFLTRLRDPLGAAWWPLVDGILALDGRPPSLAFCRAAGFLTLSIDAALKGDEVQAVRYRGLLNSRLREEYPALWPLYPDRIEEEPLSPGVRAAPSRAEGGVREGERPHVTGTIGVRRAMAGQGGGFARAGS